MTQEPPASSLDAKALEGVRAELTDQTTRDKAVDLAFDYRGDVTLHLTDGSELVGYVYDRSLNESPRKVRVIPSGGGSKQTLTDDQIAAIVFSGRDCAAGRSWETWLRKYAEKKAKGETAEITPEALD